MKNNKIIGLVKFFHKDKEEFLDKLVSGLFYCNTPESYRIRTEQGISDKVESCSMSHRLNRGDDPNNIILLLDNHEITGIQDLTVYSKEQQDSWLHCWFQLNLPNNELETQQLRENLERMKNEFGTYYAFLPAENLKSLIELIKKNSKYELSADTVRYSDEKMEWGNLCKSSPFSYQSEYRFLFGKCATNELEPYFFQIKEHFDLILKNPAMKLINSKEKNQTIFELKPE